MNLLGLLKTFLMLTAILFLIFPGEKVVTLQERSNIYFPFIESPPGREIPFKDIYFDQSEFLLREDAKPVLEENAKIIMKNPDILVVIEGYCNNNEYTSNSNLGQKRAKTVESYLTALGAEALRLIPESRCSIDHEKEKLAGNLNASWQLNNRVHLIGILNEGGRISLKTINN